MLEGNEAEGKIGAGGKYTVDVNSDGIAKVEVNYAEGALKAGTFIEIDIVLALRQLAQKTDNTLDDKIVDMVASALKR